jgi:hypothetical protein
MGPKGEPDTKTDSRPQDELQLHDFRITDTKRTCEKGKLYYSEITR